jgi:hypothetical protein
MNITNKKEFLEALSREIYTIREEQKKAKFYVFHKNCKITAICKTPPQDLLESTEYILFPIKDVIPYLNGVKNPAGARIAKRPLTNEYYIVAGEDLELFYREAKNAMRRVKCEELFNPHVCLNIDNNYINISIEYIDSETEYHIEEGYIKEILLYITPSNNSNYVLEKLSVSTLELLGGPLKIKSAYNLNECDIFYKNKLEIIRNGNR